MHRVTLLIWLESYLYQSAVTSPQCRENVNVGPTLPKMRVGFGPRTLFRLQNE